MTLVKAIRFRSLYSQLTISQHNQFFNKLIAKIDGINIIINALFNQTLQHSNIQSYSQQIGNIICKFSKHQNSKPIQKHNGKLNRLPNTLLLTKAIKFRSFVKQLTKAEKYQFVHKLFNQSGDMVIAALFWLFTEQTKIANDINMLITSIILQNRTTVSINNLPQTIIGVISSFLSQHDYINLSKTSRYYYLGCNSPNLLTEIDLTTHVVHPFTINLQSFHSLSRLSLTLEQCDKTIAMTDLTVCKQLTFLSICGEQKCDDISTFLASDSTNFDNITALQLKNFGNNHAHFPNQKFMRLLEKFTNIKALFLYAMFVVFNANAIKDLYPDLTELKTIYGHLLGTRDLIHAFAGNLNTLAFSEHGNATIYNISEDIKFSKLKHCRVSRLRSQSINRIVKTATKLKSIDIAVQLPWHENPLITSEEITETVTNIIVSCKSLERFLYYDCGTLLKDVLTGLEKGLLETRDLNRKRLNIHIGTKCNDGFNANNFLCNISKIIKLFHCSKINKYMFVWELHDLQMEIDKMMLQQFDGNCYVDKTFASAAWQWVTQEHVEYLVICNDSVHS